MLRHAGLEQHPQRAFAAIAGRRVAEGEYVAAACQPALDQLTQDAFAARANRGRGHARCARSVCRRSAPRRGRASPARAPRAGCSRAGRCDAGSPSARGAGRVARCAVIRRAEESASLISSRSSSERGIRAIRRSPPLRRAHAGAAAGWAWAARKRCGRAQRARADDRRPEHGDVVRIRRVVHFGLGATPRAVVSRPGGVLRS